MNILGRIILALVLYCFLALWAGPLLAIPCLAIAFLHATDKGCRC